MFIPVVADGPLRATTASHTLASCDAGGCPHPRHSGQRASHIADAFEREYHQRQYADGVPNVVEVAMEQHLTDTQQLSTEPIVGDVRARLPDVPRATRHGAGTDDQLQELLTVDEVAAVLKVSRSWVYEHTRARGMPPGERLPHIKIGKYVRFDARAVRAFLGKKCRAT
jgi:excisionase family DNA binding protein